uniref:Chemokine interleukin-8-like domain-containing protein n=1 Tax=Periophthalmus magnuspinnatus TaxID=409849 RepID=A0A3B4BCN5_9GOBI
IKTPEVYILLSACLNCLYLLGSYGNCCLKFVRKMKASVRRGIQDYRMQETDGDCNIRAVLLLVKRRGRQSKPICANPEDKWVQDVMKSVDRIRNNQIMN